MNALYGFFRSIKLAVTLILIIAVLSILSTLIPQGKDAAFYFHSYGAFRAQLILSLRFDQFFRSVLFLAPTVLFFINLSVCTVDRIVNRERRRARCRYGPDLIHIGLLLLIIGAMFTVFGRQEGMAYLGEGDEIRLPGGYTMHLLSYRYEEYPDGRPKDWISTVEVRQNGEMVIPSFPIEVNRPLKVGGIKVYQTSFAREEQAVLQDALGVLRQIASGEGFELDRSVVIFQGFEGETAVFERWERSVLKEVYLVKKEEQLGEYTLVETSSREVTGLKAVRDPGFIPVLIALVIAAAGLSLTILQKRKDKDL